MFLGNGETRRAITRGHHLWSIGNVHCVGVFAQRSDRASVGFQEEGIGNTQDASERRKAVWDHIA